MYAIPPAPYGNGDGNVSGSPAAMQHLTSQMQNMSVGNQVRFRFLPPLNAARVEVIPLLPLCMPPDDAYVCRAARLLRAVTAPNFVTLHLGSLRICSRLVRCPLACLFVIKQGTESCHMTTLRICENFPALAYPICSCRHMDVGRSGR